MPFVRRHCRFLLPPFLVAVFILAAAFPAAVRADDEGPTPGPTPLATDTPEVVSPNNDETTDPASVEVPPTPEPGEPTQNGVEVGVSQDDQRISADGEMSPGVLTSTLPIWCPSGVEPIAGQNGCTAEFGSISLLMDYLNSNSLGEDGQIWIPDPASANPGAAPLEQPEAIEPVDSGDENADSSGVHVVILDNAGNSIPLDSEAATNTLLSGQPVWCPDGNTPVDGGESCTTSAASLGLLVSMMENGSLDDGAIYIQAPQSDATVDEESNLQSPQADPAIADNYESAQPETDVPDQNESLANTFLHDPIWCPNGSSPNPGVGGCTAAQPDLLTLVGVLGGIEATLVDGTIWVQNGIDLSGGPILINGGAYTTWQSRTLTINGGWIGVAGDPSIVGNTTFAQTISVTGWQNDLSVNNIVIQGGATGDGLTLQTTGDVSVDTVTSNNNATGYGVNITAGRSVDVQDTITNQNRVGVRVNGSGAGQPVTIKNATANQNSASGVVVLSLGSIGVDTTAASNNGGSGVHLANSAGTGGISIFGASTFGTNGNVNIFADSGGTISVLNATVSNATATSGMTATTPAGIIIACSVFNNNFLYGLDASFFSTLALNGDTFSGNGSGPYVTAGGGPITIDSSCNPSGGGGGGSGKGPGNTFGSSGSGGPTAMNIVDLPDGNGATPVELNCADFGGTQLSLPNGDRVTYLCPTAGQASLVHLDNADGALPAALPADAVFMSAMQTTLTQGAIEQRLTSGNLEISFVIPVDMIGFDVAILYWDGSAWSDLSTTAFGDGRLVFGGGMKTEDGRFEATTNFPGTFVLVRK